MMNRYKSKYRTDSIRLRNWNYGTPGLYFITTCTREREHFFGEIQGDEMFLNTIGKIADECWLQIPIHFQNAELGDFTIMPNHVHGIIAINGIDVKRETRKTTVNKNLDIDLNVETGHALSLQHGPRPHQTKEPISSHFRFRNQGKNTLSAMIGSFKSSVTKLAKEVDKNFGWQPRFHDHIIRSQDEYIRISNYIRNNPANWKNDKFY